MSSRPLYVEELTPTLFLSEYPATSGNKGFWLYDRTRGMNLVIRAPNERAAFVKALTYYQNHLAQVEREHRVLSDAVAAFVETVRPSGDEGDAYHG